MRSLQRRLATDFSSLTPLPLFHPLVSVKFFFKVRAHSLSPAFLPQVLLLQWLIPLQQYKEREAAEAAAAAYTNRQNCHDTQFR